MTGNELKSWREQQGKSLRDVGELLGVSAGAVHTWENGQDIPGPAALLLDWLINGRAPFARMDAGPDEERERRHFWELRLNLEDWHRLEALAAGAGYGTVRDYILALIREDLEGGSEAKPIKYRNDPAKTVSERAAAAPAAAGQRKKKSAG